MRTLPRPHLRLLLLPPCQTPPRRRQRTGRPLLHNPVPERLTPQFPTLPFPLPPLHLDRTPPLLPPQRKTQPRNPILRFRDHLLHSHIHPLPVQSPRHIHNSNLPPPPNPHRHDGRKLGPTRFRRRRRTRLKLPL